MGRHQEHESTNNPKTEKPKRVRVNVGGGLVIRAVEMSPALSQNTPVPSESAIQELLDLIRQTTAEGSSGTKYRRPK